MIWSIAKFKPRRPPRPRGRLRASWSVRCSDQRGDVLYPDRVRETIRRPFRGTTVIHCNLRRSPYPPRASGRAGTQKSGNFRFFLTYWQFESQDCASPLMTIAHTSACASSVREQSPNASDWTRPRGRHGALKAPLCIGARRPLLVPIGICVFVVGNFNFYGDSAL